MAGTTVVEKVRRSAPVVDLDALLDCCSYVELEVVEWPASGFSPSAHVWIASMAPDMASDACPFWMEEREHAKIRTIAQMYIDNPTQRNFSNLCCAIEDCLPDNLG